MLLGIIKDTIASQPDMDVVEMGGAGTNLLETAADANADVIILAREGVAEGASYRGLLAERPRLKVIEILESGRSGSLHEMRPCRIALGELSPAHLLNVIRETVDGVARPN